MINGKELWDRLAEDICNIILNSKSNLIFLIGDNSTGKSEIGNMLKDKITVLDNYRGLYDDIPEDEKVLVITHDINLLLHTEQNAKVIITQNNSLYISADCCEDNYGSVVNMMNNSDILSTLLTNAISGSWSKLNEEFFQDYLSTNQINDLDKVIINVIENFKK